MFFLRAIGLVRGSSVGAEEQNQEAPKDDNDAEQGSACTTFGLQRARMLRYCRQEKEKKNNGVHQVFYRFDPHRIANLPPKERPKSIFLEEMESCSKDYRRMCPYDAVVADYGSGVVKTVIAGCLLLKDRKSKEEGAEKESKWKILGITDARSHTELLVVAGNQTGEKDIVRNARFLQECKFEASGPFPSWDFIVKNRWDIIAAVTARNELSNEPSEDHCDSDSVRHSKRNRVPKRFQSDSEESSDDSIAQILVKRGQKRKSSEDVPAIPRSLKKRRGANGAIVSTSEDYQVSAVHLEIEKERTIQKKLELMKSYTGPAVFHNVVTTNTTMEFGVTKEKA